MLSRDEHFVPLWSERYVAALPSSHPLTLKDKLRTADLAGVPLIDRCFCERGDVFRRYAPPRMPAAIAETEDWAIALVAAGVGVAIVPEGVVRANAEVAVRELEIKVTREVGLAYSAKRPPSDALRDLVARVRKQRPATKSTRRSPPGGKPALAPRRDRALDHGPCRDRRVGGLGRELADQAVGIGGDIVGGLQHQPFQRPAIGRDTSLQALLHPLHDQRVLLHAAKARRYAPCWPDACGRARAP
jgi:hypothetical protein